MDGGKDGVAQYVRHVHSWASGVRMELHAVRAWPKFAVVEWTMTGVQDRPIDNIVTVATGKRFALRGGTLVEVSRGKITRAADYMDVAGFLMDLGSRIELPGGTALTTRPK